MSTIYDIAKKVGCASSTVSKALNNSKEISEKRKAEILAAAKELGYVPNSSARRLTTKKSWSIGIIFSEDLHIGLEHHFFSGIIQEFKKYVEGLGYEINFYSKKIGNQTMTYLEWFKYRDLDGILIVTVDVNDDNLEELRQSKIPVVTVDSGLINVPTVISDNFQGTRMALEYLMSRGAKTIAHIAGPLRSFAAAERLDAFQSVLSKYGMQKDVFVEASNYDFKSGKEALYKLLQLTKELPDAVYAANDDIALGAIMALKELGYKIPRDVSVIGFDNIELTRFTSPSLTTVKQDRARIGTEAAKLLIAQIDKKAEITQTFIHRIPVELIIRESTK